jgi:tetratricopeptide (TPR) repeat protein
MERKIYQLIVFLLLSLQLLSASPAEQVYKAYISGDMRTWKNVLAMAQNNKNPNLKQRLERVNFQYGYIAWCIGNKKTNEAKEWLPLMEADLDFLEKAKMELSTVYAYRAALYGYQIGLSKLRAPFLGPKSNDYAKKAIETNPKNPLGHQQYGNILYYTPGLFGGSKEDAAIHLLKSLELMEAQPEQLKWNWNYLSLITSIAIMYYESGKRELALNYLSKALKAEPEYQWVKNELYPHYQKK